MPKLKVSMTIDEDIFASFKSFCKQNGMKVSTKVEQLMKDNLKNTSLQQFLRAPAPSGTDDFRRRVAPADERIKP